MEPTYNPETGRITIPRVPGVRYTANGYPVSGSIPADGDLTIKAALRGAARFREGVATEWQFGPDSVDRSSTKDDPPGAGDESTEEII